MRPYSRGEKALPLQPFSWQLSADIDLEKKKKERKSVKEGKLNGSTGANYNVMKARQKYPSYTHTHHIYAASSIANRGKIWRLTGRKGVIFLSADGADLSVRCS